MGKNRPGSTNGYVYVIDTCSLMSDNADDFLDYFFKEHKDKMIIVPKPVAKEIKNHIHDGKYNLERYNKAIRAQGLLDKYADGFMYVDITYTKKDVRDFNDMYLYSWINTYRETNFIVLITQDHDLARATLSMNLLKFMHKSNPVEVRFIDEEKGHPGRLKRFRYDTDPLSWKLLDPEISGKRKEEARSNAYIKREYGTPVETIDDIFDQIKRKSSPGKYRKDQNGNWVPPQVISVSAGYHLADGTLLEQGKRIGGGGEGDVYQINGSERLMKLYKSGHGYNDYWTYQKLLEMTNHQLKYQGICFPIDIVYDKKDRFAGYTMDAAKGGSLKLTVMGEEKAMRTFNGDFKKLDQINICLRLLDMFDYIHGHGMLVGDISSNNIMVDENKKVYLIDTDSFQIGRKFRCNVGTPEFVPPELIGKNFSKIFRTKDNENFSIALLLFNILVGGAYPYSIADDDMTQNERTVKGIFPYYFSKTKGSKDAQPPNGRYRFTWSHLTSKVKKMFGETFSSDGDCFHEHRYKVRDWQEALKNYKYFLTTTDEKFVKSRDPMSLLAFPTQYKKIDEEYLDRGEYVKCKLCGEETLNTYIHLGLCPNCQNKKRWTKGDPDAPRCRICGRPIYSYTYLQYYRKEPFPDVCPVCQSDIDSGLMDENGNKTY